MVGIHRTIQRGLLFDESEEKPCKRKHFVDIACIWGKCRERNHSTRDRDLPIVAKETMIRPDGGGD